MTPASVAGPVVVAAVLAALAATALWWHTRGADDDRPVVGGQAWLRIVDAPPFDWDERDDGGDAA